MDLMGRLGESSSREPGFYRLGKTVTRILG